jgi:hypothetical protein
MIFQLTLQLNWIRYIFPQPKEDFYSENITESAAICSAISPNGVENNF